MMVHMSILMVKSYSMKKVIFMTLLMFVVVIVMISMEFMHNFVKALIKVAMIVEEATYS